jgi:uncharacterized Tic20 family protein
MLLFVRILYKFIGLHSFSICFVHLLIVVFLGLFYSVVCFTLFTGPCLSWWWYGEWLCQLTGKKALDYWITTVLWLCHVFNVVGARACLHSLSFSIVLGFLLFGFVIVHLYALCSGLIVATNTCSCARVEDVHCHLIVKKRSHI